MISVIIPFYNAEKYLDIAIKSVLNQSFENFELILLDDGSNDKSLYIANSFNDKRIKVISDGENKGLPYRLNQMIELASFDLIARMDADDIIPASRLKKQYDYLKNNSHIDLVSMGMGFIDDVNINSVYIPDIKNKYTTSEMLVGVHGICHATLLIRRKWLVRNKYDSKIHRVEDHELWLHAYFNNDLNIGFIPEVGYFYRSDVNLSKEKYKTAFLSGFKILNKHKDKIPLNERRNHIIRLSFKLLANEVVFLFGLEKMILSRNKRDNVPSSIKDLYIKTMKNISKR